MTGLLLTGGTVLPMTGAGKPLQAHDVLCQDGTITAVAPTGTLEVDRTAGVEVVDCTGRWVLPGFVDAHVHLTTVPGADPLELLTAPASLRVLRAVPALRATLEAGVTTVRDLSGADDGMRTAVAEGTVAGPRLLAALRILSITGGHGDWRSVSGVDLTGGSRGGAVADGPAEFVRATREVVREGADWIKVAASGGMGSPRSEPDHGGLTEAELRAVVEEAARHAVAGVAAHAQGTAAIAAAVRAGVRSIEHGYGLDEPTLDLLLEHGTFLVPTLATLRRPFSAAAPAWSRRKRENWLRRGEENLARAFAAGAPVVLGTDAGVVPHGTNLAELGHLVELGLSPLDALRAGTSTAARMLGLEDEIGSLRPGARADLVVVDVDPLRRLAELADPRHVRRVVLGGSTVVLRDGKNLAPQGNDLLV